MEKTQTKLKKLHLKPKEKEFVKVLVHKNNENGTQTAQEVFDIEDSNYAGVKAHRLISNDKISQAIEIEKETLKSALEKRGVTPDKIALTVSELLNAKDKDGNDDFTAKDKGLKHALNIHGVEDADNKPKVNTTYNFIFSKETQDKVKEINEVIKAKLINNESNTTNTTILETD